LDEDKEDKTIGWNEDQNDEGGEHDKDCMRITRVRKTTKIRMERGMVKDEDYEKSKD